MMDDGCYPAKEPCTQALIRCSDALDHVQPRYVITASTDFFTGPFFHLKQVRQGWLIWLRLIDWLPRGDLVEVD